ncbi:MAG: TonB-dependent receptor [Acidobacteriota bacterium]|nr:TonB-dependent receptor [Acidobacteriota bacterium]
MKYDALKRAVAMFGVCLLPWCAFSQEKNEEKEPKPAPSIGESLVVWATEIRTSSVKLDDDALAVKQPDHISDLLRALPGVDVGGAHSLNQRITIRGMDDKDLRIDIDGANQNTYMYHHMGNLQIHADILKSVDIDVGKNSVVNGGLGGTVRFETKDAADLLATGQTFGSRLLGNYGDNASTGYSAAGYGKLSSGMDFLAYYNFVERDNYKVGGGEITDADGNIIAGTDGKVRGHEGEVEDSLVKLGWDFGPNHRIEAGFEHYADTGDYNYRPDMGLATDLAIADNLGLPLIYPTEFTRDTITLNYNAYLGGATTLRATVFQNQSELWRDETGVSAVFGGASIIEGDADNTGFNLLASTIIGEGVSHQFNYGVDLVNYETQYTADGAPASEEDARNTAFFIEDRIQWGNRFTIVPGVRYDQVSLDSTLTDEDFSAMTAGLAVEAQLAKGLSLTASGTQLFKAPEIGEVFLGAGLYDTPNPEIEEETGMNTELGLTWRGQDTESGRFSAGLTGFQTDIDDYIYDYVRRADGFRGKDNVGDMQIDGYEAFIGYDLGDLRALVSFSSTDSELSAFDEYASLDGARLDRQQGDDIGASLDYNLASYDIALHWDGLHVASVDAGLNLDGATKDNAKDSYSVHNISIRWTPRRYSGLSLTLGVDNLFDEYYASQSSRTGVSAHPRFGDLYLVDYEPGRNIKTTMAYRF